MERREFLKATGLAAMAVPFEGLAQAKKHYVWMRPSLTRSDDEWARQCDQLKSAGFTGIIPEVYNGSSALWGSTRLPVRGPWLERAIPIAARAGLEVHAWMWCMPCLLPSVIREGRVGREQAGRREKHLSIRQDSLISRR